MKNKYFIYLFGILLSETLLFSSEVFAYNRNAAASYADTWAFSNNSNYPTFSADCTNFASQALAAGGYPQINYDNNSSATYNWYAYKNWWQWWWNLSNSWSVAADQYRFQMDRYPGGWLMDVVRASDARYWYAYDNANMWQGDELFYNWHNDTNPANISHMGFQTYGGPSAYNGVTGDRQDQHSNFRRNARWNLTDVNNDPYSTVIFEVRIDNAN